MKKLRINVTLLFLTALLTNITIAAANECSSNGKVKIPWSHGEAVLFRSNVLNIDADGAPNSYLLDGRGLSYTCDGVVAIENGNRITPDSNPSDWQEKCNKAWTQAKASNNYRNVAIFGFQTDESNRPLIQTEGDPFPGKGYISATSIVVPGAPERTQRRYVDATKIPYVVLPPSFISKFKVKPGSLAIVYRKKTDRYAFAVYADGGKLGEASVRLHQDLGSKPIVKIGGIERAKSRIEDQTLIVVFPSRIAPPVADTEAWNTAIQSEGSAALDKFGGIVQLQRCAK